MLRDRSTTPSTGLLSMARDRSSMLFRSVTPCEASEWCACTTRATKSRVSSHPMYFFACLSHTGAERTPVSNRMLIASSTVVPVSTSTSSRSIS